MITKNTRKNIFRKLAEAASTSGTKYARLSSKAAAYGDYIVTIRMVGYEAFRKEGDRYIPVSFHCEHNRGYAHEIWEGETYHIKRREIKENSDEAVLWKVLTHEPHLGHYEFDPDEDI